MGEGIREARPHLDGRAFAPGAAAEEMGEHGAGEDHRRHAERNLRRVFVDRVDDEARPRRDRLSPSLVDEPDRDAGDGEQVDEPSMRDAVARGLLERDEEDGRRHAA